MKTLKKYDVVLLTEGKYVNPTNVDWYTDQVLTEDGLVKEALEKRGIHVTKKDWADPKFDWSTTRFALFRTTWDYFHRFQEFDAWLDKASKQTNLINTLDTVRWNMDKHYLIDLQKKGIPIVETAFIEKGSSVTLKELHAQTGWTDTVLKPAISGAGRHTYKLYPSNLRKHEAIFQQILEFESMLLQPYQESITIRGEISIVVIDGNYSHSVLKKAKEGDYRVQDDFGGSVHPHKATKKEIDLAEDIVRACSPIPVYARVDLMWNNENKLVLGELELVEPEMWFRNYPAAADLLAEAIEKML